MAYISVQYFKSEIGELIIGSYENELCLLDYTYRKMRASIDRRISKGLNAEFVKQSSSVIEITILQLNEYFAGSRHDFTVKVRTVGSEFQKQVWDALSEIPYGATTTYLKLAQKIGNEKAVRAVASANGANAIGIIIPCHRVIGSDGSLVGFAGGLTAKRKLLKLEQSDSMKNQLPLFN